MIVSSVWSPQAQLPALLPILGTLMYHKHLQLNVLFNLEAIQNKGLSASSSECLDASHVINHVFCHLTTPPTNKLTVKDTLVHHKRMTMLVLVCLPPCSTSIYILLLFLVTFTFRIPDLLISLPRNFHVNLETGSHSPWMLWLFYTILSTKFQVSP